MDDVSFECHLKFIRALVDSSSRSLLSQSKYEQCLKEMVGKRKKSYFNRIAEHYEAIIFLKSGFFKDIGSVPISTILIQKRHANLKYVILSQQQIAVEYFQFRKTYQPLVWDTTEKIHMEQIAFVQIPLFNNKYNA